MVFSLDKQELINLNLTERLKAIVTLINIWKGRKLSLKSKITILRTLILPQVQFLFTMIAIPETTAKIKRSTIIAPIELGGLAMLVVYKIHSASKCSWIKRLYDTSASKWKTTFLDLLNIDIDILNKNLDSQIVK